MGAEESSLLALVVGGWLGIRHGGGIQLVGADDVAHNHTQLEHECRDDQVAPCSGDDVQGRAPVQIANALVNKRREGYHETEG
eukprot:CAMPEP_0181294870 /NCGR_PEP_ID=MMETSP1101-20121128/3837_1 /TAXON_ID=46948 /ORGANISM="Rhodomonas abbreviata, Strain Caron Lab Isolate" /LENGTH=82 /DNA_ID=CAMNT_0023399569 /DNA_START=55 /DNA_END=303 /DNA_ORIENTATION=+